MAETSQIVFNELPTISRSGKLNALKAIFSRTNCAAICDGQSGIVAFTRLYICIYF